MSPAQVRYVFADAHPSGKDDSREICSSTLTTATLKIDGLFFKPQFCFQNNGLTKIFLDLDLSDARAKDGPPTISMVQPVLERLSQKYGQAVVSEGECQNIHLVASDFGSCRIDWRADAQAITSQVHWQGRDILVMFISYEKPPSDL